MRIKSDFVTNSSSSSFIMVGVNDIDIIQKYINAVLWSSPGKKINLEEIIKNSDLWEEYDGCFDSINNAIYQVGELTHFFEPENERAGNLGLELEPMLKKDMRFSEMKEELIKVFNRHNIEVKPDQIDFHDLQHYG